MTCDQFRAAVLGSEPYPPDVGSDPALAGHTAACAGCRAWFDLYAEGAAVWTNESSEPLARAVMARTSGSACDRAQLLLASSVDGPRSADDAALEAGHLSRCAACRAFNTSLADVRAGLAELSELDPGLGFATAVFARTSRRPPLSARLARARAAALRVMRRPRIAWEFAYVVTLCWLLVFGSPVAAVDWTASKVATVTADTVPRHLRTAQTQVQGRVQTWRERWAGDLALVADTIVGRREAATQRVAAAQRETSEWWARVTSDVAAFIAASWDVLVQWVGDLFGAGASGQTEPPAASVRSRE